MDILIYGGDIYTPDQVIPDGAIGIENGHIVAIGPRQDLTPTGGSTARAIREIDARGKIIAPGLIDLQVNGAGGRLLTEEPSIETVATMAKALPQFGCTSFLPTIISAPKDKTIEALEAVAQFTQNGVLGAKVLGSHLEGPFINPDRAGVHQKTSIRPPSAEELKLYWDVSNHSIQMLTLAPEMPNANEVIRLASQLGILVAAGHSNANYRQLIAAQDNGVKFITHLFNAMGAFTSREPGTAGAALVLDKLTASVIADGIHVHPASIQVAVRAKGPRGLVLVTDAMPPIGSELTEFKLYDLDIVVRDGGCFTPDGTIAGSALTMNRAVKNMNSLVGVPLPMAFQMASSNPAGLIPAAASKGKLSVGSDADIILCDTYLNIYMTIVEGAIVYESLDF